MTNRYGTGRVLAPGEQFNGLTFVRELERTVGADDRVSRNALFECECGEFVELTPRQAWNGIAKSCGCRKIKNDQTKWKMGDTPRAFGRSWYSMKYRCRTNPAYAGVSYDPRWEDFNVFADEMLATWFPGAVLGRYRDQGGYTPDNCRWITRAENNTEAAQNRR